MKDTNDKQNVYCSEIIIIAIKKKESFRHWCGTLTLAQKSVENVSSFRFCLSRKSEVNFDHEFPKGM